MKKTLCFITIAALLACLMAGCNKDNSPAASLQAPSTAPTSQGAPSVPSSEASQPTSAPATHPAETQPSSPPATQPATTPSTQATAPATKPTTSQGSGQSTSNLIASGTCDNGAVNWKITKDGTLTVSGRGDIGEMNAYPWKKHFNDIKKIVVEGGITSIPKNAFSYLHEVTSVAIGEGVKTIGQYAIFACNKLASVTIAASVETIEDCALSSCAKLTEVKFVAGSQLKSIGRRAFSKSGIREFDTPDNLHTIDEQAFLECKQLESVRLDSPLSTLGTQLFYNCTGLKSVYFGEAITGTGYQIFSGCTGVTKLEDYNPLVNDFTELKGLTTLVIGGNRTSTSRYGYTNLSSVTILSPITEIAGGAFIGCQSLTSFTIPETVTAIGSNAFRSCGITSITIPNSVTTIGEAAFYSTLIKKITIPASVSKLGKQAFYQSSLEEITFLGDCPIERMAQVFPAGSVTAYYPADNDTWTEDILKNYAQFVTWVAQ